MKKSDKKLLQKWFLGVLYAGAIFAVIITIIWFFVIQS